MNWPVGKLREDLFLREDLPHLHPLLKELPFPFILINILFYCFRQERKIGWGEGDRRENNIERADGEGCWGTKTTAM